MTLEELKKMAKGGDAEAQNILGMLYLRGDHVDKDLKAAAGWFRKAADQGNATAMFNLAQMYAQGDGVKKSEKSAFEWFKKSAEGGDADAAFVVGRMYIDGKGVDEDVHRGIAWLIRAALGGNDDAREFLKSNGIDVPDGAEAQEGSGSAPEEKKSDVQAKGAAAFKPLIMRLMDSKGIEYERESPRDELLLFEVDKEECNFAVCINFNGPNAHASPSVVSGKPVLPMFAVIDDDGDVHIVVNVRENVPAERFSDIHEACSALSRKPYLKCFLDEKDGTVTAAWNGTIDMRTGPAELIYVVLLMMEAIAPSLGELLK
ncbi:MAG: sel1 repeat family protein [Mailhella sp.]|nr:sel1 repeat family protein [Mailhella sp.]